MSTIRTTRGGRLVRPLTTFAAVAAVLAASLLCAGATRYDAASTGAGVSLGAYGSANAVEYRLSHPGSTRCSSQGSANALEHCLAP